mgnify:CR=1 FL=1
MILSKKIKMLREKRNISQKELADMIGVSQAAIHYWENGTRTPKVGQLHNLALALNVSITDLVDQQTLDITDDMLSLFSNNPPQPLGDISPSSTQENYLMVKFRELNEKGQDKAIEQVEMLTKIPEYRKEETPEE